MRFVMYCRKPAAARMLQSVALRYHSAFGDRPWGGLVCSHRWGPWWSVPGGSPATDEGLPEGQAGLARLEAVLFLGREPLSSRKLAQLAGLADGTQARTLIRKLRARYDARSRGFQVEEVAGGFQLLTRPRFGKWLRRLQPSPVETRLSAPALETLVVVAYCQPVLRAEVEAVRGVQCGEILRQLLERDLVRIAGRSSELGRPFLYGTTKRFLQVFGLRHLDQLPWAEQLRSRGIAQKAPVENEVNGSHDRHSSQPAVPQKEEVTPVSVTDQLTATVPAEIDVDTETVVDELEEDDVEEQTDDVDEFDDAAQTDDDDDDDDDDESEYEYVDEDDDEEDEDDGEEEDEDDDDEEDDDEEDDEYEYEDVEDDDEEEEDEKEKDEKEDDEYEYEYVEEDEEEEDDEEDDDDDDDEEEWEEVDDDDDDDDEWEDDDDEWEEGDEEDEDFEDDEDE